MAKPRRRRISTLLDADLTIAKVDSSLDGFNATLEEFNVQLERFAAALDDFRLVVAKIDDVGTDLATIAAAIGPLVAGIDGVTGPARAIPEQLRRLSRLGRNDEQPPESD